MKIFECDRCGECYRHRVSKYPKLVPDIQHAQADLCPSCQEQLRHWFERGHEFAPTEKPEEEQA